MASHGELTTPDRAQNGLHRDLGILRRVGRRHQRTRGRVRLQRGDPRLQGVEVRSQRPQRAVRRSMAGSRKQARPGRVADLDHHQSRPDGPLPPKGATRVCGRSSRSASSRQIACREPTSVDSETRRARSGNEAANSSQSGRWLEWAPRQVAGGRRLRRRVPVGTTLLLGVGSGSAPVMNLWPVRQHWPPTAGCRLGSARVQGVLVSASSSSMSRSPGRGRDKRKLERDTRPGVSPAG